MTVSPFNRNAPLAVTVPITGLPAFAGAIVRYNVRNNVRNNVGHNDIKYDVETTVIIRSVNLFILLSF